MEQFIVQLPFLVLVFVIGFVIVAIVCFNRYNTSKERIAYYNACARAGIKPVDIDDGSEG